MTRATGPLTVLARRRQRSVLIGLALAGLALGASPRAALAQWNTVLTLGGWPLTVTNTTGNDFEAGFVSLGSTTINVNGTSNLLSLFTNRETTVQVQCVAACPRSGTLTASGIQWRRDDQATWTDLTTGYVDVEQRVLTYNGTNDPWQRTMHWRYVLSWTAHPPTAASQFRVRFRLVVAAP